MKNQVKKWYAGLDDRFIRFFMFLVAISLILYVFPREGKFRYEFAEGKPWHYGLLTASYDFPIFKTDKQVKHEQDSVLRYFQPYFQLNEGVGNEQLTKLKDDYNRILHLNAPTPYYTYLNKALEAVYAQGIVEPKVLDDLLKEKCEAIMRVERNTGRTVPLNSLLTVRKAYEKIVQELPAGLSRSVLQSLDISNYLNNNLDKDLRKSDESRAELLGRISVASGMVQADERIIDKGEIVTSRTYAILYSLKRVSEQRSGNLERQFWALVGEVLLILALFSNMFFYLRLFRFEAFKKKKMVLFILIMITSFVLITSAVAQMKLFSIYFIPYAIVPLIVRTFFDSRTALFTHIITVLLCSFMAPFPFEFLLLQITAGMTAIYTLKDLTERSQIVRSAALIFLTYLIIYVAYTMHQDGEINRLNWRVLLALLCNSSALLFSYLLIYLFEKSFGFVSNVTLVELANINLPILREFSEVCPGTFQHSLQVSNLAANAALRINANAALVRTGALYHDIGKMENPAFFTENQTGVSPHDSLSNKESAKIVIDHVANGVRMARKLGLPEVIVDFIYTHHGDGKAKYFYYSEMNAYPDKEVDANDYTYPGPKPQTKEMALVMMADSVEAASRSLVNYTEESIREVVERIIDGQIAEGMFKHASITFHHVELVKQCFIEKLKIFYHTRISYPNIPVKVKEEQRAVEVIQLSDSAELNELFDEDSEDN